MKQSKLNFAVFAASLCALLVLVAAPVMAHDENGTGAGSAGSSSEPNTGTSGSGTGVGSNSAFTGTNEREQEVHDKVDAFQKKG